MKFLMTESLIKTGLVTSVRIVVGRLLDGSIKGSTTKLTLIPNTKKDVWDLRCLGVEVPPASSKYKLKFDHILQPWLRQAAKLFYSPRFNSKFVIRSFQ